MRSAARKLKSVEFFSCLHCRHIHEMPPGSEGPQRCAGCGIDQPSCAIDYTRHSAERDWPDRAQPHPPIPDQRRSAKISVPILRRHRELTAPGRTLSLFESAELEDLE